MSTGPFDPAEVYRYFDSSGRLLYVGVSLSAAHRAASHRADKWWWRDVARIEVSHFSWRQDALTEERRAIIFEQPMHNFVHAVDAPPYRRSYRVGSSSIEVVEAVYEDSTDQIVIDVCPNCGATHRHGLMPLDRWRGMAHRYPHCHRGAWREMPLIPYQLVRFRRPRPGGPRPTDYWSEQQALFDRNRYRIWRERATSDRSTR